MKEFRKSDPENYERIIRSIPAQRITDTDSIAKIVSWLCCGEADYIQGQMITVDGGLTLI